MSLWRRRRQTVDWIFEDDDVWSAQPRRESWSIDARCRERGDDDALEFARAHVISCCCCCYCCWRSRFMRFIKMKLRQEVFFSNFNFTQILWRLFPHVLNLISIPTSQNSINKIYPKVNQIVIYEAVKDSASRNHHSPPSFIYMRFSWQIRMVQCKNN